MDANNDSPWNADDSSEIPVEIRGEEPDEAAIENIWIAGQPVGILLKKLGERVADLEAENELLREELEDTSREAKGARGVAEAKARADGAMASKKEQVLQKVRNELVRRACKEGGRRITLAGTKKICRPELSPHNQEVYRAWDELTVRWNCFNVTKNAKGNKSLIIEPSRISDELVAAVEAELSRDDLSNSVVTAREGEGG